MRTVLTIAGSDPSGGAGVQGDLKTFAALGVYGMGAITALTVQNTTGVTRVVPVEPSVVIDQIDAVFADIPPDAVKIGMLGTREVVMAVAEALGRARKMRPTLPIVLDPVMSATAGGMLLDDEGVGALVERLLPFVTIVTPNLAEASRLAGFDVDSVAAATRAATALLAHGANAVVVTGGHLAGPPVDVFADRSGVTAITGERVASSGSHGTGCAYASAVAARLALGDAPIEAARAAQEYVRDALRRAPGLGHGRGPLGHA
jgi:hydroxymethylpyrimidine/phosphomethylpyrimidine kinase